MTEIHDFLRILYSAAGVPHDLDMGQRLERMTTKEIVESLCQRPARSRLMVLAPLPAEGEAGGMMADLQRQGFVRVRIAGEVFELEEASKHWPGEGGEIEIVVDRLVVKEGVESRLADSVEIALRICGAEVRALVQEKGASGWDEVSFATSFRNPSTGFEMGALTPYTFHSTHLGACEDCHGLGTEVYCDPFLWCRTGVSQFGRAVAVWTRGSKKKRVGTNSYRSPCEALWSEFT